LPGTQVATRPRNADERCRSELRLSSTTFVSSWSWAMRIICLTSSPVNGEPLYSHETAIRWRCLPP